MGSTRPGGGENSGNPFPGPGAYDTRHHGGAPDYVYGDQPGTWVRPTGSGTTPEFVPDAHPDAQAAFPDGQAGVPLEVWGRATGGLVASFHLDQSRWVKVTAFVDLNEGQVEIPIVDDDGIPYLGPETVPMFTVRRAGFSAFLNDEVTTPGDTVWGDELTGWKFDGQINSFGIPFTRAYFKLGHSPYPHWILVIEVTADVSSTVFSNVMVDLIGSGAVAHGATSVESGSDGNHGHYLVNAERWTDYGFLSTPANEQVYNHRRMTRGAIDVAGGATGTYYLATPNALSTDSNAFSGTSSGGPPLVQVFGENATGSYVTHTPDSNWTPTTFGLGGILMSPTLQNPAFLYVSSVEWDVGANRWKVFIFNNITGSAANRTFYVFAIGRK